MLPNTVARPSVECTRADPICSLGWPTPELQSARLATTLTHQSVAIQPCPSPDLQLLFIVQDILSRATLGSQYRYPPIALWHPTIHCGFYHHLKCSRHPCPLHTAGFHSKQPKWSDPVTSWPNTPPQTFLLQYYSTAVLVRALCRLQQPLTSHWTNSF